MPKNKSRTLIVLCWITLLSVIATEAKAQYSLPDNSWFSADTTEIPQVNLGEVVIRSTREKRPLQELPISATLIPQTTIEQQQIESLSDLTSRVPNLYMPSYGSKLTSPIYIRGIGSRIESPSIGLYVDHLPQFDKSSFDFDFYDVERIEVLRGSQGATHGRNNMGGIIHVFTRPPVHAPLVMTRFTAGNYGLITYGVQVNHAREQTAFQLGAQMHHHDGYFTNLYNHKKVDHTDVLSGRFRVMHDWNSPLKTDLIVSFEQSEQGGYPYGMIQPETGKRQEVNYNDPSGYDRNLLNSGIINSYRLGNWNLRSTTSFQFIDDHQYIDQDLTPAPLYFVTQDQDQYNLSHEITAEFNSDQISATLGAFGFHLDLDRHMNMSINSGAQEVNRLYDHQNNGFALFAQTIRKNIILEGLNITPGLRFDWEKASQDYSQQMHMQGVLFEPRSVHLDGSMTFYEVLPRLAIDYEIIPQLNTYVSAARGYKTGGFNITIEQEEDRTYDAEHSWTYEAGLKSKWLFDLFRFSASAYYVDWSNQQVTVPVPSLKGTKLINAGKSTSQGFEGDFAIQPVSEVTAYFSFGTARATFREHYHYSDQDTISLKGNHLPFAPSYTMNTGFVLSLPTKISVIEKFDFSFNHQTVGKIYWDDTNQFSQSPYHISNATIGLHMPYLHVSIWAKNIFDRDYNIFEFSALTNRFAQGGAPAHFGVTLKAEL